MMRKCHLNTCPSVATQDPILRKKFKAHSADQFSTPIQVRRRPDSSALLAALAALEEEFRDILQNASGSARPEESPRSRQQPLP
jgi:glutamate synthase domain-containing protein 2